MFHQCLQYDPSIRQVSRPFCFFLSEENDLLIFCTQLSSKCNPLSSLQKASSATESWYSFPFCLCLLSEQTSSFTRICGVCRHLGTLFQSTPCTGSSQRSIYACKQSLKSLVLIIKGKGKVCIQAPGYFLINGYWGCAAGWGRIFMTRLTIMGSPF